MATNQPSVQDIIRQNPSACYRTLVALAERAGHGLDAYYVAIADTRPLCGYECEHECPYSKRPEN